MTNRRTPIMRCYSRSDSEGKRYVPLFSLLLPNLDKIGNPTPSSALCQMTLPSPRSSPLPASVRRRLIRGFSSLSFYLLLCVLPFGAYLCHSYLASLTLSAQFGQQLAQESAHYEIESVPSLSKWTLSPRVARPGDINYEGRHICTNS